MKLNHLVLTLSFEDPIQFFIGNEEIGSISRHSADQRKLVLNFKDEVKILRKSLTQKGKKNDSN